MATKEFLEARQKGIGGSDVAGIVQISKYNTPYDIWASKVEPVQPEEPTDAQHFGNVLEDVIAREFTRRTGIKVIRRNKPYVHKEYPFLLANIDRLCLNEQAGLEIKTSNAFMKDEWGKSGTDEVPLPYIAQCIWYMNITGLRKWWLAALIGGNDFRCYSIPWNEKLAKQLEKKCVSFWNEFVIPRVPPPAVNLDDIKAMYSSGNLAPIVATEAIEEAVKRFKTLRKGEGILKKRKDEKKFEIQKFMKDHDGLMSYETGDMIATWRKSEKTGRRTFLTKD